MERYETFEQWEQSPDTNSVKEWLIEQEMMHPGYGQAVLNTVMAIFKIGTLDDAEQRGAKLELLAKITAMVLPKTFPDVPVDQFVADLEYMRDQMEKLAEQLPENTDLNPENLPPMTIPDKFKDSIRQPGTDTVQ